MERAILDRFRYRSVKNYALLSSLPFVYNINNNRNEIIYANEIYVTEFNISNLRVVKIILNNKSFEFDFDENYNTNGRIGITESNDSKSISLNKKFDFVFSVGLLFTKLSYIGDIIRYHFLDFDGNYIHLTRDGKVNKLMNTYCYYHQNDDFITIDNIRYKKLSNTYIIGKVKIVINFYPNGELQMYTMIINKKRHGIFYFSDESGNFGFMSYHNDELHGFYFNLFTSEQGFYNMGRKVGFWEEQGKIINYDNANEIFFLFPVFIM